MLTIPCYNAEIPIILAPGKTSAVKVSLIPGIALHLVFGGMFVLILNY